MDARSSKLTITLPSDRAFVLTRTFDAPRDLVFRAWTMPEHVKRWYGCNIMTMLACDIDLRVGGAWRYVLRTPDGAKCTMQGLYREIEPPAKLVYTEGYLADGFTSPESLVTVLFNEHAGRTTLTSTVLHATMQDRDGHLASGVEHGANETFNRLDELLFELTREARHGAS